MVSKTKVATVSRKKFDKLQAEIEKWKETTRQAEQERDRLGGVAQQKKQLEANLENILDTLEHIDINFAIRWLKVCARGRFTGSAVVDCLVVIRGCIEQKATDGVSEDAPQN